MNSDEMDDRMKCTMGYLFVFGLVFMLAITKISGYDIWLHLKAGEYIFESRQVPHFDPFSFTAGSRPWIAHDWFGEVLLYLVYRLGGLNGLILLKAAVLGATFALLLKLILDREVNLLLAIVVTFLACLASSRRWIVRPHLFSFFLLVLFLYLLRLYTEKEKNYLYLLALLSLIWVNLHGGFFLGLMMIGIHLSGELVKLLIGGRLGWRSDKRKAVYLTMTFFACLGVSFINPNTYRTLLFPMQLFRNRYFVSAIVEWTPPQLSQYPDYLFMLALTVLAMAWSLRSLEATDLLLIVIFTYLAFSSRRNIALFALVASPILAKHIQIAAPRLLRRKEGIGGSKPTFLNREIGRPLQGLLIWLLLIAVAGSAILGRVRNPNFGLGVDESQYPIGAAQFIEENQLPGNMYNLHHWGGYLIWRLFPKHKVFIDGRTIDLYGEEIYRDDFAVVFGQPGWREVLYKYDINFVLLDQEPSRSQLRHLLETARDWKLIYQDEVALIFIRDIPENRPLIDKFAHQFEKQNVFC